MVPLINPEKNIETPRSKIKKKYLTCFYDLQWKWLLKAFLAYTTRIWMLCKTHIQLTAQKTENYQPAFHVSQWIKWKWPRKALFSYTTGIWMFSRSHIIFFIYSLQCPEAGSILHSSTAVAVVSAQRPEAKWEVGPKQQNPGRIVSTALMTSAICPIYSLLRSFCNREYCKFDENHHPPRCGKSKKHAPYQQ